MEMRADVLRARPTLDPSFDALIDAIPEGLVKAPDDFALDPELSRDPYKLLLDLRDREGPVVKGVGNVFGGNVIYPNSYAHDMEKPYFLVLGIEEVERIAMDSKSFINDGAYGAHSKTLGEIPTLTDGKRHTELRSAYNQVLGHRSIQGVTESLVDPTVDFLMDRMARKFAAGETVDIPRDFGLPLIYKAMSTLIGVPQEKFLEFVVMGELLFTAPLQPEKGGKASQDLFEFYMAEVDKRKGAPRDDLTSWFMQAEVGGRHMTDPEVAQHARFLLPAGIETTWRQISMMFAALLGHPDQYRLLVENPELMDGAIEESIRYYPSGFRAPRMTARTTEVAGVEIPEGSALILVLGIANRDPRRWTDPNRFDIRREPKPHRTFNLGVHTCAGQHLVRLEMRAALREAIRRFPNMRLACKPEEIDIRGASVRTPLHVPVLLD